MEARQLEIRLSELLGEYTWRGSGLGAPDDIDQLNHRIVTLEQQTINLQLQSTNALRRRNSWAGSGWRSQWRKLITWW